MWLNDMELCGLLAATQLQDQLQYKEHEMQRTADSGIKEHVALETEFTRNTESFIYTQSWRIGDNRETETQ